jgi:hypothetical protein
MVSGNKSNGRVRLRTKRIDAGLMMRGADMA